MRRVKQVEAVEKRDKGLLSIRTQGLEEFRVNK